jgi:hypothetical protein
LAEEVPSRVVSSGSLRNLPVGGRFDSVDEVRKEDRILDEEDRNVVADDICKKS